MNTRYYNQQLVRFFQVIFLLILLLVERVVGLPIIFFGVVIQAIDLTEGTSRKLVFLVGVILAALVYQFSFLLSFILLSVGTIVWFSLRNFSSSKTARLLISTAIMLILLVNLLEIEITVRVALYSLLSLVVVIGISRTSKIYL